MDARGLANNLLNYHVQGYKPASEQLGLLSMALPSPFGDVAGLLGDAAGYAQNPETLTPGRGLLSLAGVIPGIPRMGLPNSTKQLDVLRDALGKKYISGEIDFDQYREMSEPLAAAWAKAYAAETRQAGLGKMKPIWEDLNTIPPGTKVRASHGLTYKDAMGTVTGSKFVQLTDGLYHIPLVDFGDGKARKLLPNDIHEVFRPRAVK